MRVHSFYDRETLALYTQIIVCRHIPSLITFLKQNSEEVKMMETLLLNDDYQLMQDVLQKFAEKEIAPLAAKRDEEEYFDWDAFRKMAKNGFTGVPWPVKYGGAGMDYVAFIHTIEELSKVCGATGSDLAIHTALASWPIFTFGTEEQKHKYLHQLAQGKKLGAFSLTEPNQSEEHTSELQSRLD